MRRDLKVQVEMSTKSRMVFLSFLVRVAVHQLGLCQGNAAHKQRCCERREGAEEKYDGDTICAVLAGAGMGAVSSRWLGKAEDDGRSHRGEKLRQHNGQIV